MPARDYRKLLSVKRQKQISESALVPVEPVTVILSEMGWVRCAKGHDIDPQSLSYKAGDNYLAHVCGRSNQQVIFLVVRDEVTVWIRYPCRLLVHKANRSPVN